MKIRLMVIGLGMLFFNGTVFAELDQLEKYDNFNAKKYSGCKSCINSEKWIGFERGDHMTEILREVKSKKLHFRHRSWGGTDSDAETEQGRNRMRFRNSELFSGACFTPRIKKYEINSCAANDDPGMVRIRYIGNFYDTDDNDDADDGVIYAGIALIRDGNSEGKASKFSIEAWATQCDGEDCEDPEPWSTYDDVSDPDLVFGTTKGSKNKKAMCIGYDSANHELVFSYGNDVRIVNAADHGLPAFDSVLASSQTWHVIEAITDVPNCTTRKLTGAVDADFDDAKIRRFSGADISGVWTANLTDDDLLAFVFFEDGTYVHLEIDERKPFDQRGEMSGMEWGTYSRDSVTGQLTVTQVFDANGDTGLTDAALGFTTLFAQVYGDTLRLQFDDNQNGSIGNNEYLDFSREVSNDLLGVWTTNLTDDDLLAFVFFADGTYVHLEIDEQAPIDQPGEMSGMEWGTYSRDSVTGQLTVTQVFDANGDTGLTDAALGFTTLFAQVSGDTLTLQFDDNLNGTIEMDEFLDFQRNFE